MDVDQGVVHQPLVIGRQLLVVDDDVELELVAEGRGEVGDRQRGDVPVAAVLDLGDVEGAALGDVDADPADVARGELVGGQLAAGDVIDDVLPEPRRRDDLGVAGLDLHVVPVAGEVVGRVEDDRPAAVLDPPERVGVRVEVVLGPPDRVLGGERLEVVLGLGEDLLDEVAEALVEALPAAARLGEDQAAVLDVEAERPPGPLGEDRVVVAVEVDDRRLEQVLDRRVRGVDDLPGDEVLPVRARPIAVRLAASFVVVVPVARRGPCFSLLIRTGDRPLARKSTAKLVASSGSLSWPTPCQIPWNGSWSRTSSSAPSAIPSRGR